MHLYWRVIEELKSLGETWTFSDPALQRNYHLWLKKHAGAIAQCLSYNTFNPSVLFEYKGIRHSLN
ncbi:hypothetical protein PITCH_A640027 [uncultured Desulfobacterium sp.]|uniref:Uncharacterized protein n=1 Tax=uncultured Desulfobacterium sp. TaxID=201089 RepID=A0A445N167_9BACT|nr:hypothetical protein PITCH_A640027 [uncultured Desulfobacterium sp.]